MALGNIGPGGPGVPDPFPGVPAARSVGDRLIPSPMAWRDRCPLLCFRSGPRVTQPGGEDTSDRGWEAVAEYDGADHIVASIGLAPSLM